MRKINILFPVLGGFLIAVSLLGVGLVNAQDTSGNPFVEKLAQKLGLSQEKVQVAVEQIHEEQRAEMDKKLEERLNQAVKDGKITEDQKKALLEKLKERKIHKFETKGSSVAAGSAGGRVVVNDQGKKDFETWAKENGLTMELIRELIGGGEVPGGMTVPQGGAVQVQVN